MKNKIIVFYDGSCGMCSKEIKYYKSIAPTETFTWVDITRSPLLFTDLGYKLADGLKVLHVRDENKIIRKGVDAFIAIWRQIRYWKTLSYFFSIPIVKQLLQIIYLLFAKWRFKKMNYDKCKI